MVFNPQTGRAVIAAFNTACDDGSTPAAQDACQKSDQGFRSLIEQALGLLR